MQISHPHTRRRSGVSHKNRLAEHKTNIDWNREVSAFNIKQCEKYVRASNASVSSSLEELWEFSEEFSSVEWTLSLCLRESLEDNVCHWRKYVSAIKFHFKYGLHEIHSVKQQHILFVWLKVVSHGRKIICNELFTSFSSALFIKSRNALLFHFNGTNGLAIIHIGSEREEGQALPGGNVHANYEILLWPAMTRLAVLLRRMFVFYITIENAIYRWTYHKDFISVTFSLLPLKSLLFWSLHECMTVIKGALGEEKILMEQIFSRTRWKWPHFKKQNEENSSRIETAIWSEDDDEKSWKCFSLSPSAIMNEKWNIIVWLTLI